MLFSEPKIPQSPFAGVHVADGVSFSALQRAENSSIVRPAAAADRTGEFQCSSASRKFLNSTAAAPCNAPGRFQCSSASRKFLNVAQRVRYHNRFGFSALQRAENSSIDKWRSIRHRKREFQCSSASRKFLNSETSRRVHANAAVSVLFSEPKIPQSRPSHLRPSIFPTATITLRHF